MKSSPEPEDLNSDVLDSPPLLIVVAILGLGFLTASFAYLAVLRVGATS